MHRKRLSRDVLLPVLIMLVLGGAGCSSTSSMPDCPGHSIPISPISSPSWHPAGQLLTYNLVPLSRIEFPNGADCSGRQVFDFSGAGVYGFAPDSMATTKLLSQQVSDPSWAPAGDRLVFEDGSDIYTMHFDGVEFDTGSIAQLTFDGGNFDPAWSFDGTSIAYERVGCAGPSPTLDSTSCAVLLMTPSGANKRALVNGRWPAWTSDSQSIIFVGLQYELYEVNLDDTTISRLTYLSQSSSGIHNSHPSVSPDGTLIAFASQPRNGSVNIWLVNADGSNPRKLTSEGTLDRFYWSPDSQRIVYVSYRTTDWTEINGSLWVVNILSGEKTLIAKGVHGPMSDNRRSDPSGHSSQIGARSRRRSANSRQSRLSVKLTPHRPARF